MDLHGAARCLIPRNVIDILLCFIISPPAFQHITIVCPPESWTFDKCPTQGREKDMFFCFFFLWGLGACFLISRNTSLSLRCISVRILEELLWFREAYKELRAVFSSLGLLNQTLRYSEKGTIRAPQMVGCAGGGIRRRIWNVFLSSSHSLLHIVSFGRVGSWKKMAHLVVNVVILRSSLTL